MKDNNLRQHKVKKIKFKHTDGAMTVILQNWLLNKQVSNIGLISLPLHHHIRKFVKGCKEICLSEELQ